MRYRLVAQWLAIALAATSFAPSVSIRALADGASHAATLSAAEIRSGIAALRPGLPLSGLPTKSRTLLMKDGPQALIYDGP